MKNKQTKAPPKPKTKMIPLVFSRRKDVLGCVCVGWGWVGLWRDLIKQEKGLMDRDGQQCGDWGWGGLGGGDGRGCREENWSWKKGRKK